MNEELAMVDILKTHQCEELKKINMFYQERHRYEGWCLFYDNRLTNEDDHKISTNIKECVFCDKIFKKEVPKKINPVQDHVFEKKYITATEHFAVFLTYVIGIITGIIIGVLLL